MQLLLSPISDIAVQCEAAVAQPPPISFKSFKTELQEFLMESSFNVPRGLLIESLGWKTVRELIDEESKITV